uniref:RdRp catalytic domain-containing protein n=1 Tax=Trichuris muris TaxID=70415 RepID=A0A5S6QJ35_TRIMR
MPHALGGYPVLSLLDFLYPGHPDPCTAGICALKILARHVPMYNQVLHYLNSGQAFAPGQDYEALILDPVAINWNILSQVTTILRQAVESQFASLCRNKQLTLLFHSGSKTEDASLIATLVASRPFAPRVVSEIYRNPASRARVGVLATVSHVRTVRQLAQRIKQESIFAKVVDYETAWIRHLQTIWRLRSNFPQSPFGCSTRAASRWRSHSWFPLETVVLEGVTTPHPAEQFILKEVEPTWTINEPGILFVVSPATVEQQLVEKGPYRPYIGNISRAFMTTACSIKAKDLASTNIWAVISNPMQVGFNVPSRASIVAYNCLKLRLSRFAKSLVFKDALSSNFDGDCNFLLAEAMRGLRIDASVLIALSELLLPSVVHALVDRTERNELVICLLGVGGRIWLSKLVWTADRRYVQHVFTARKFVWNEIEAAHDMLMTEAHTVLAATARELQFAKVGIQVHNHTLPSMYDILTIKEDGDSAVTSVSWVEPVGPPSDEGAQDMYPNLYDSVVPCG